MAFQPAREMVRHVGKCAHAARRHVEQMLRTSRAIRDAAAAFAGALDEQDAKRRGRLAQQLNREEAAGGAAAYDGDLDGMCVVHD